MVIAHWILVIVISHSQGMGSVTVPMVSEEVCLKQQKFVNDRLFTRDSYCIQTGY